VPVVEFIEVRVTSNWGNPNYTCLYRFRVHGDLQTVQPSAPPAA
jgi:SUN domain-containing protein 1/2